MRASRYTETHKNWQLCKIMLTPDRDPVSSIDTAGYDAAIIQMPSTTVTLGDMMWLGSLPIPAVLLNVDTGSFAISNVRSADGDGAILGCDYL